MAKVRVYEIARELSVSNQELVAKVRALGIEIANHMSVLDPDDVARVRRQLEKERQERLVEHRVGTTIIRRRSKSGAGAAAPPVRRVVAADQRPGAGDDQPLAATDELAAASGHRAGTDDGEAGLDWAAPGSRAVEESPPPAAKLQADLAAALEEVVAGPARATSASSHVGVMMSPAAVEPTEASPEPEPAPVVVAAPAAPPVAPTPAVVEPAPVPAAAAPAAAAAAPVEAPPAAPVPEKLGPTGRFIDLNKSRTPTVPKVVITDMSKKPGMGPRGGRQEYYPRQERGGQLGRLQQQVKGKGKKRLIGGKKTTKIESTLPAEHKRRIRMQDAITLGDLAKQMGLKATEALKKLWGMGMTGITINATLDFETAGILSSEFGFEVENVAFHEDAIIKHEADAEVDLISRSPVVTIMGHVDHGKTSLLDAIRKSDIVSTESGGITQHIGAYKVKVASGEIVFIDTPGHEAFSAMRARGAGCTDIVVLVVAAEDGVMPQTKEAISHAQAAKVPIIVAINKMDKPEANPERIKQDLTAFNLVPEDWGGDTLFVPVSAVTKVGVDKLLETILMQAEMLELKANPNKVVGGVVLEAELDKARGPVATVLVLEGTLRPGDIVVAGEHMARVRALVDDRGRNVREAGPATPVQILGLTGVPDAGEPLHGVKDEKDAKKLTTHRAEAKRRKDLAASASGPSLLEKLARGEQKELKVVLKADQQGTSEAVREALGKLTTTKVELIVVQAGVGAITESDINLAKASGALVVGFHVRPTKQARDLAEKENVEIKNYAIIYEMLDDVKDAMRGLLPKERREKIVGRVEVRDTFSIPKIGTIAGCFVTEGKVIRNAILRVFREHVQVYQGRVSSLRRFKEDAREVEKGYECGIGVENYNDLKVGDAFEVVEIEELAAEL